MKVSVNMYEAKPRVMTLAEALTPYEAEGGQIERLERLAEATAKAVGNIAALLVEKGLLEIDEAVAACAVPYLVERIVEETLAVDAMKECHVCDGWGSEATGIDEAPSRLCRACSGNGSLPK